MMWTVTLVLVYSLCSLFALSEFFGWPGVNEGPAARFGDMIYGRAQPPYVTRVLLPATIRHPRSARGTIPP